MKRPRTRVAEAIALRGYHSHMKWIHSLNSNQYPWNSQFDKELHKFLIAKKTDKPIKKTY